jgi:hypothetical protein
MAKPPVSYGNAVKLAPSGLPEPPKADPDQAPPGEPAARIDAAFASQTPPSRRRPMESRSDPTVLYLHPDGKYELKRYALALGPKVKVHDLIMEAVEEWASRHGITAPFRVPSEKPRRLS